MARGMMSPRRVCLPIAAHADGSWEFNDGKIYAPASIGNVSVGFDVLGAAVSPVDGSLLGDCVSVEAAEQFSLQNKGRFDSNARRSAGKHRLPVLAAFLPAIGKDVPVAMTLEKNMPIGSGLGSSACSVVAGLMAMNEFCGQPLNDTELLALMGELEGRISGSVHYDNVAPCFLGGVQLMIEENGSSAEVPCFADWLWVMAYPGIKVSTAEARAILPAQYRKQDAIKHGRLLAGFIHACTPVSRCWRLN